MKMTRGLEIPLPPRGFINVIAERTGISRQAVSRALRQGSHGKVARRARAEYKKLYVTPYLKGDEGQLELDI